MTRTALNVAAISGLRRTYWAVSKLMTNGRMDDRIRVFDEAAAVLISSLSDDGVHHLPIFDMDYPVHVKIECATIARARLVVHWAHCTLPYYLRPYDELRALMNRAGLTVPSLPWRVVGQSPPWSLAIPFAVPARAVPSSNPDHRHLYVDRALTWELYAPIVETMGDVGLMQAGFSRYSLARQMTMVLKPGLSKDKLAEMGIQIQAYGLEPQAVAASS